MLRFMSYMLALIVGYLIGVLVREPDQSEDLPNEIRVIAYGLPGEGKRVDQIEDFAQGEAWVDLPFGWTIERIGVIRQ